MQEEDLKTILLVGRSLSGCYPLRNALIKAGAVAIAASDYPEAYKLLSQRPISTVIVEFAIDKETVDFCNELRRMNLPLVFTQAPPHPSDLRTFGFSASFPRMFGSPELLVHYSSSKLLLAVDFGTAHSAQR